MLDREIYSSIKTYYERMLVFKGYNQIIAQVGEYYYILIEDGDDYKFSKCSRKQGIKNIEDSLIVLIDKESADRFSLTIEKKKD